MVANSNLVWVNKTQYSSSLSNCRNEKDTFRKIRSRALIAGHKSSRASRPIPRTALDLNWARNNITKSPTGASQLRASSQSCGDKQPLPLVGVSQSENCNRFFGFQRWQDSPLHRIESGTYRDALPISHLSGIPDPFSSYSVELDTTTLNQLWYFENIWTQCAFKIPDCIGYGQEPVEPNEVTSMIIIKSPGMVGVG